MIKYHFNRTGKKKPINMKVNLYELMYSSGAQGEYAGLRVIRAYHEHQGAPQRRVKKRK